ncbi:nuclease-related domain-containing protein, partial [Methylomonas koyamae]
MDLKNIFLQTFGTAISAIWWLVPLSLFLAFLKSPFVKGMFGEFQVNLLANLLLDKQYYTLFKNVTLPTENGTTQIDHIIVSRFGVFVIETKNMKGWIYGSSNQKTWTQKIYKHTTTFQNPLHQNYKHTQTLRSALEIDNDKIFPVVVFIGDSEFKTAMPDNVVYAGRYIQFIKEKSQLILSNLEVMAICKKIESGRLSPTLKTHVQHVKHVNEIVEARSQKADNSCPKCG